MTFDLGSCVSRHEDVCVGFQAFGATLSAATLEVANLLDASVELGFPCLFGNVDIFAVEEDVLDGVGAVRVTISTLFASKPMTSFAKRDWERAKTNLPPSCSVAEIFLVFIRDLSATRATGSSRLRRRSRSGIHFGRCA